MIVFFYVDAYCDLTHVCCLNNTLLATGGDFAKWLFFIAHPNDRQQEQDLTPRTKARFIMPEIKTQHSEFGLNSSRSGEKSES